MCCHCIYKDGWNVWAPTWAVFQIVGKLVREFRRQNSGVHGGTLYDATSILSRISQDGIKFMHEERLSGENY